MAIGDDAAAAGMAVLNGTEDRRQGYVEINRTRDYIAQKTAAVMPISKGGTGQTTAAGARNAFGLGNTTGPVPVANGGTGAASAADARTALGCAAVSHTHSWSQITSKPSTFPPSSHSHDWSDITGEPSLVTVGYLDDRIGPGSNVPIYSLHGRNNPVTTSYVSAYLNSDGRIAATPSARRFKQDIEPHTYTLEQLQLIQVVTYRLKTAVDSLGDAAPYEVGVIAEQLVDAGLPEFVAYDAAGQTVSVHYERLVLVAISAMQELAGRVADIESRLAALEGSE